MAILTPKPRETEHRQPGNWIIELDHVQLAAPQACEGEARRFFGELLGLPELEKPAALRSRGGCWFQVGARQLHIGVVKPFRCATKAHPAFAVRDIAALFARLQQANVPCTWDDAVNGVRRFYAADPWNNRLEFTEPTFSRSESAADGEKEPA